MTIDLGQTIDCYFVKCNSEGLDPSIDTTSWFWNGSWTYPVGLPVHITASGGGWTISFANHSEFFTSAQMSVRTLIDGYGNPFTLLQRLVPDAGGLFEIGVAQGCCVTPGVPEPATWAFMLVAIAILVIKRKAVRLVGKFI